MSCFVFLYNTICVWTKGAKIHGVSKYFPFFSCYHVAKMSGNNSREQNKTESLPWFKLMGGQIYMQNVTEN